MKRLAFFAPSLLAFALLCFQSLSLQAQSAYPDGLNPPIVPDGLNLPIDVSSTTSPRPPGLLVSPNGNVTPPKPPTSEPLPQALVERGRAVLGKPAASDGWTWPAAFGQNCAVYFVLQGGVETDMLKSVSTAWADKVEIHQTTIDEQGVARMAVLPELDVAAESKVEFSPRGLHLMVSGLKRELRAGQFFPVLLNFEHAGQVRLMITVRKQHPAEVEVSSPLSQPQPIPDNTDMNHAPH